MSFMTIMPTRSGLRLLAFSVLVAAFVVNTPTQVAADPKIWFGFYQDDLPTTSAVTTLHIASDVADAINAAHYGQKSVLLTETYLVNTAADPFSLHPNWQTIWSQLVPVAQELLANGTIIGFDLGDELVHHCMQVSEIATMANAIRASFPSAIIWYNEAHTVLEEGRTHCGTVHDFSVPSSLSWFSVDIYHMDGKVKDWVPNTVTTFYKKYVDPLLTSSQRYVIIPGSFGSNSNNKCNDACYDHMCAYDARQFADWALSDGRIAAVIPWTWGPCGAGCIKYQDELGTVSQPNTKNTWWALAPQFR